MAITINGSGTITGVSAGGLPDGSITADDLATSLDLTGKTVTLPSGTGGKVLQVITDQKTDTYSVTGNSSWNTISNLSVTMTPSAAGNKQLVVAHINGGGAGGQRYSLRIQRDGSSTTIADASSNRIRGQQGGMESTDAQQGGYSMQVLEDVAGTSAITWSVGVYVEGTSTFNCNRSHTDTDSSSWFRGTSSITVMEIEA